jgi:hypothetical protein
MANNRLVANMGCRVNSLRDLLTKFRQSTSIPGTIRKQLRVPFYELLGFVVPFSPCKSLKFQLMVLCHGTVLFVIHAQRAHIGHCCASRSRDAATVRAAA